MELVLRLSKYTSPIIDDFKYFNMFKRSMTLKEHIRFMDKFTEGLKQLPNTFYTIAEYTCKEMDIYIPHSLLKSKFFISTMQEGNTQYVSILFNAETIDK